MSTDSDNHPDNIEAARPAAAPQPSWRWPSRAPIGRLGYRLLLRPTSFEQPLGGSRAASTEPDEYMPQTSRVRRFSLPELANERVDDAISSFLSGPEHRRGRREPAAIVDAGTNGSNGFGALETRIAWMEALRREAARSVRYRRPAAVMVIAGVVTSDTRDANGWLTRMAGPIAHAIHRGIRETDLATRTGDARFQVLLTETTAREARHVAERVVHDCQVWLQAVQAPLAVRAASAGTAPDTTLEMALEQALHKVEAARSS